MSPQNHVHFARHKPKQSAIDNLAKAINQAIHEGKHVLWMISGGSTIDVTVQARNQLINTTNLVVMQVDERFGPVGHANSNWQQLLDRGFDTNNLVCHPILIGEEFDSTASAYSSVLQKEFEAADLVVGLLGVGADGHTAGILPGSPAVRDKNLLAAFIASDYQRITITPAAIAKINLAIVYAVGKEKAQALQSLQETIPISKQPAQALKLAGEVYVYNDYLEANT